MLKYFYFLISDILGPLKSYLKYPHVQLHGRVMINNNSFIGEGVRLFDRCIIGNSSIGDYTYVGGQSRLDHTSIGKFCSIASGVNIGLGIHPTNFVSTYPAFYSKRESSIQKFNNEEFKEYKKIFIKNDVWIGNNATVMDGVTIGNGAVIAAGSIVTKDVPDYAIVGGVPAKIIKMRFSDKEIQKLLKSEWWDWDIQRIKEYSGKFNDIQIFLKSLKF